MIWKFIAGKLLSPLGLILDRLGNWIGRHKELVIFILLGTSILFLYTTFDQTQKLDQTRQVLGWTQLENDSLQRVNGNLVYDRDNAKQYAQNLTQKSNALKDSIRNVVRALPPTERTKLNRQLLSNLGFVR